MVIGGSHGRARYQTGGMNGTVGFGPPSRSLCVAGRWCGGVCHLATVLRVATWWPYRNAVLIWVFEEWAKIEPRPRRWAGLDPLAGLA